MAEEAWVGLAEAIRQVRAELTAARLQAENEELRFEPGPVEIEFGVEVHREGGGAGAVRIGVVSVEGKGGRSTGSTHRLKLVLNPVAADGTKVRIADRRDALPPR